MRNRHRASQAVWVAALLCCVAPLAQADWEDFYYSWSTAADMSRDPNTGLTVLNTLLVPAGGNFEGMGTAYTAVSYDSGYIESNPAASCRLQYTELSLLHRNWIADANVESIVYTMRFGDIGAGVAGKFLHLPFTEYDNWGVKQSKARIGETILTFNGSYNLLRGYRYQGLAVGGNIKLAYRGIPGTLRPDQSAFAAMIDLGVLTRFNLLKMYASRSKNFSVGATIRHLGPFAAGEPLPTMATLGVAYSIIRPILISVDLNLPFTFDPYAYPATLPNAAVGLNVNITPFLSLQTGVWLRMDNPRFSLGVSLDLEPMSIVVNYNVDLSGGVDFYDKLSIEAKISLGDQGRGALQARIDGLFVGAINAYKDGALDEAIELATELLELYPQHEHAQQIIDAARRTRDVKEGMDRKQSEAAEILSSGDSAQDEDEDTTRDEVFEN